MDEGPVLPKHPPITLVHITKYLSVSSGTPGPMNFSHHPSCGFIFVLCAWLDAERPVCNRIALLLSSLRFPHVSYATSNSSSIPPQSRRSGSFELNVLWRPVVYEGSGPDAMDLADRNADLASWASMQGKERAGFEEP